MSQSTVVARIGKPHGLHGEVTVQPAHRRARAPPRRRCRDRHRGGHRDRGCPGCSRSARRGSTTASGCVAFEEIPDRTGAESLRGTRLVIDGPPDVRPTTRTTSTPRTQLRGLDVVDPARRRRSATVPGLDLGAAQDRLVVRLADGREAEVPFVAAIVPEVDVDGGRVVVDAPPGLFDLGVLTPGARSTSSRSSPTTSRRSTCHSSARRAATASSTSACTTCATSPTTGTARVDDSPFGGGAGMVMKPEPWAEALDHVVAHGPTGDGRRATPRRARPRGVPFTQALARSLAHGAVARVRLRALRGHRRARLRARRGPDAGHRRLARRLRAQRRRGGRARDGRGDRPPRCPASSATPSRSSRSRTRTACSSTPSTPGRRVGRRRHRARGARRCSCPATTRAIAGLAPRAAPRAHRRPPSRPAAGVGHDRWAGRPRRAGGRARRRGRAARPPAGLLGARGARGPGPLGRASAGGSTANTTARTF